MSSTVEMSVVGEPLDRTRLADGAGLLASRLLDEGSAVLEGLHLVEYRLAVVAALVERFGSRHAERAASELQAAVETLAVSERRRQVALGALAADLGVPETATFAELVECAPTRARDGLRRLRAAMLAAKHRIEVLAERAEDILGRRMALVAEVLASASAPEPPIYGRELRSQPRFVDGLL
jgi:hypothetical protein